MALEIRHNRAEHTHENEQFRRVATMLRALFEQKSWNGLLIGNPFNDDYGRFRADAILLYNHGLIVIDFKDYSGTITLPSSDNSFRSSKWYTENPIDKQRILIKAGARFINPFRQLHAYRGEMFEIVRNDIYLNKVINPNRTLTLNIFSGPIQVENCVPKNIPYYKIIEEQDIPTLLYDYSSDNKFSNDSANAFKAIFQAAEWQEQIFVNTNKNKGQRTLKITCDIQSEVDSFLKQESGGVLILESMDTNKRDEWMKYILSEAVEFGVPQTETWCHSSRIARKISSRSGGNLQSLYNMIYGGGEAFDGCNIDNSTNESNTEQLQEFVPIRNDTKLDNSAVVILHEAHLVTRSLYQTETLRFGTGRLLEDLMSFMHIDTTKRKLICIGDPYSLSYGKDDENALNEDTISEFVSVEIKKIRSPLSLKKKLGKHLLRSRIALQIEKDSYNFLDYRWEDGDLVNVKIDETKAIMYEWFGKPCTTEPQQAILVYSNKKEGAQNVNRWIKQNCLKNGEKLSKDDLIIINKNVNIPDQTGFGHPARLANGMYLLVQNVGERIDQPVKIKTNNVEKIINLVFVRLSVCCLSVQGKPNADIWLLNNDFNRESDLSKEEQIAFRVFVNKKVSAEIKSNKFEDSSFFKEMGQSEKFQDIIEQINQLREKFNAGERVKTKLESAERRLRVIERAFRKRHREFCFKKILQIDPFVNAVSGNYGWAITVHKAVGSSFSHVLLNANQGDSRGVTNQGYYRWLYSGLTAANVVVNVVNPIVIHPLKNCVFEDIAKGELKKYKPKLIFHDYDPDELYREKLVNILKSSIIGTICEFSKLIEKKGYTLLSAYRHGDYLTKVNYGFKNKAGSWLVLSIDNKGEKAEWAVTSIRIEKANGIEKGQIVEAIKKFFSGDVIQNCNLPNDFRRDVYQDWENALKRDGISLTLTESIHEWQDVFYASDANSSVCFRVWYNGKGFINKVSVFKKSGNSIIDKLKNLVTQWNQNSN